VQRFGRLVVFVIVSFLLVFLISGVLGFLDIWINSASSIPAKTVAPVEMVLPFIYWILPLCFYVCILLSANYALMNKVQPLLSFVFILAASSALLLGGAYALNAVKNADLPPIQLSTKTLGLPGLMLDAGDSTIVLLGAPALDPEHRVIVTAGEPLNFVPNPQMNPQEGGESMQNPPLSFVKESNTFFNGLHLDFMLCAQDLMNNIQNFIRTLILALSLGALLLSISFIFKFGNWYLANLFLSIVLFRAVLYFEVFINSLMVQDFFSKIFQKTLPQNLISPLIFTGLAVLFIVFMLGMAAARAKGKNA